MSLIDGIGDEVTHFFIGLFVVIVGKKCNIFLITFKRYSFCYFTVTVAWWTTNISEQRHVRTVLLLERRRHRTQRRLTNHTEAVTITDGIKIHIILSYRIIKEEVWAEICILMKYFQVLAI